MKTDFTNTVIDFDTDKNGIQEGKEWIALISYLRSMDDADGDGVADMNETYRKPGLRVIPVKED